MSIPYHFRTKLTIPNKKLDFMNSMLVKRFFYVTTRTHVHTFLSGGGGGISNIVIFTPRPLKVNNLSNYTCHFLLSSLYACRISKQLTVYCKQRRLSDGIFGIRQQPTARRHLNTVNFTAVNSLFPLFDGCASVKRCQSKSIFL